MKPKHRSGGQKASDTDNAARSITAAENAAQSGKTERLKEARLKQEAADVLKPKAETSGARRSRKPPKLP